MDNPLGTGKLTTEDMQILDKLATYFNTNYRKDIESICVNTFGSIKLYGMVAALIAAGYALKMYEMGQLEDNLFKNVENK